MCSVFCLSAQLSFRRGRQETKAKQLPKKERYGFFFFFLKITHEEVRIAGEDNDLRHASKNVRHS